MTTSKWSSRKDTIMLVRAILAGWDIPIEEGPEVLAHLRSVLETGKGRRLTRVRAAIARLESDIAATPDVALSTKERP